jgi:hypothetical protein
MLRICMTYYWTRKLEHSALLTRNNANWNPSANAENLHYLHATTQIETLVQMLKICITYTQQRKLNPSANVENLHYLHTTTQIKTLVQMLRICITYTQQCKLKP